MGPILAHQSVQRPQTLLRGKPAAAEGRPLAFDPVLMLRRFTDLRPGAPGNGLARKPQRPSVAGKLIQERIGHGVVRLPRVAHDADPAREEHKQIKIPVQGRPVQMPGAQDLRPQHGFEFLPGLIPQCAVRQHPHAVDHPAKGRQCTIHALKHGVHRGKVRHVRQFHPYIYALSTEVLD